MLVSLVANVFGWITSNGGHSFAFYRSAMQRLKHHAIWGKVVDGGGGAGPVRNNNSTAKKARLRLFVFLNKKETTPSGVFKFT